MATNTTTYSFLKPTVGGDTNLWGGYLNSNWDDTDDLLDGTTPVTGIDIDSGSIDGTPIGAASASTGAFTTLAATTANVSGVLTAGFATIATGHDWDAVTGRYTIANTYEFVNDGDTQLKNLTVTTGDVTFDTTGFVWDQSAGQVGIGTSITRDLLTLFQTTGQVGARFQNTATGQTSADGAFVGLGVTGGATNGLNLWAYDASQIVFGVNNTEIARFDATGNLGVGVTPACRLHVSDTTAGDLVKIVAVNDSPSSGPDLVLDRASATPADEDGLGLIFFRGRNSAAEEVNYAAVRASTEDVTDATEDGRLEFFTTGNGSLQERMRIAPAGSVGIGEQSPLAKLHVTTADTGLGSLAAAADEFAVENTGDAGISVISGNTSRGLLVFGDSDSNAQGWFEYRHTDNSMAFVTAATEQMWLTNAGNLNIGQETFAANTMLGVGGANEVGLEVQPEQATDTVRMLYYDRAGGVYGAVAHDASEHIFRNSGVEVVTFNTAGEVGIGEPVPLGKLHVKTADSGATLVGSGGDELVLENSGTSGMTILSGNTSGGFILFGDDGQPAEGRIEYNHSDDSMRFSTSSSEQMRLDVSGRLTVGSTTVIGADENTNTGASIYGNGSIASARPTTASNLYVSKIGAVDGEVVRFARNGSDVGSIDVSAGATAYNTTSDYRRKEDLKPIADPVARLRQIKMYDFAWKEDPTKRTEGVMAHELQSIVPQAVTGEKDGEEMQKVDYSKLVPLLTEALQNALDRIEALEATLSEGKK